MTPAFEKIRDLPSRSKVPALTAAQMAEADRRAIEDYGIAVEMLMENAAHQVARVAQLMLGDVKGRRIVCLCGPGNNGGDAIGAARRLHGWGADASCVLAIAPDGLRATARRQHDIARAAGLAMHGAETSLETADLIVDGLLGYSARGAPRGDIERLITRANASGRPILAVDLPSGLDPDTGEVPGAVIRATCTVTLALPKAGLLAARARDHVGEVIVADIGIPPTAYRAPGVDVELLFSQSDLVRIGTG